MFKSLKTTLIFMAVFAAAAPPSDLRPTAFTVTAIAARHRTFALWDNARHLIMISDPTWIFRLIAALL